MTLGPIRNETEYEQALAEIDRLMDVDPHTPESDRLEVLVTLVERYESVHWPVDLDPYHGDRVSEVSDCDGDSRTAT